jgi:hypothetical protein
MAGYFEAAPWSHKRNSSLAGTLLRQRMVRSMGDSEVPHYKEMAERCEQKAEALAKSADRAGEQPSKKPSD